MNLQCSVVFCARSVFVSVIETLLIYTEAANAPASPILMEEKEKSKAPCPPRSTRVGLPLGSGYAFHLGAQMGNYSDDGKGGTLGDVRELDKDRDSRLKKGETQKKGHGAT